MSLFRRNEVVAVPVKVPEPQWWTEAFDRLVMVHMDDDTTTRGLVVKVFEDGVKLSAAERLTEGPSISLAGEVFLPREHIVFVQVPPLPKPVRKPRTRSTVSSDQGSLLP